MGLSSKVSYVIWSFRGTTSEPSGVSPKVSSKETRRHGLDLSCLRNRQLSPRATLDLLDTAFPTHPGRRALSGGSAANDGCVCSSVAAQLVPRQAPNHMDSCCYHTGTPRPSSLLPGSELPKVKKPPLYPGHPCVSHTKPVRKEGDPWTLGSNPTLCCLPGPGRCGIP